MAEIGYTRSTDSRYRLPLEHTVPQRLRTTSHWSKPHRIRTQPHVHRVHPIMAEQVLEVYPTRIHATRLRPDYSTTSPHAHTHAQQARTCAMSRGGALFVLFSRSSFSGASLFLWLLRPRSAHAAPARPTTATAVVMFDNGHQRQPRVPTKLATQRNMCTNIHETPHIT